MGREVWAFFEGPLYIRHAMFEWFRDRKASFSGREIVLVVDSFGGVAETAYRIGRMLQAECKSVTVVVPRFAKSAATLLVLAADDIVLGGDAHLGPLDVQFWDYDVEEGRVSALDTVQAVEQLEDSAIDVATRMLETMKSRTHKSYNLLLEPSLKFAAEVTKPLFEKIDAVSYSRRSRMLREAEDYAIRLLVHRFSREEAAAIAHDLVTKYPTHEFVIDLQESARLGVIYDDDGKEKSRVGLHAQAPKSADVSKAIEKLYLAIHDHIVFGKLVV